MAGGFFEVEYIFRLTDKFSKTADDIIKKMNKIRQTAVEATQEFSNLNQNVTKVGSGLTDVTGKFKHLNTALVATRSATRSANSELRVMESKLQKVGKLAIQVGRGMFSTGAALSASLTYPIMAGYSKGASNSIDIEKALVSVRKTIGMNATEGAAFQRLAYGLSSKHGVGVGEILRTSQGLASANVSADSQGNYGTKERANLLNRTELVMKAADAFEMPVGDTGNYVGKIYSQMKSAYGKDFKEGMLDNYLNFINVLEDKLPVKARDILKGSQYRSLGAGLALPGKMNPYDNATLQAMLGIQKSPETASRVLSILYRDLGDRKKTVNFSDQFNKDPIGSLIPMLDKLANMKDKDKRYKIFQSLNKAYAGEYSGILNKLPEIKKFHAFSAKYGDSDPRAFSDGIKQELGGVSVDESYMIVMNSFYKKFDIFKTNIVNTWTALFDAMKPSLIQFFDFVNPKLQQFTAYLQNNPNASNMINTVLIGLAALGPVLMALGAVINAVGTIIIALPGIKMLLNNPAFISSVVKPNLVSPTLPKSISTPDKLKLALGNKKNISKVTTRLSALIPEAEAVSEAVGLTFFQVIKKSAFSFLTKFLNFLPVIGSVLMGIDLLNEVVPKTWVTILEGVKTVFLIAAAIIMEKVYQIGDTFNFLFMVLDRAWSSLVNIVEAFNALIICLSGGKIDILKSISLGMGNLFERLQELNHLLIEFSTGKLKGIPLSQILIDALKSVATGKEMPDYKDTTTVIPISFTLPNGKTITQQVTLTNGKVGTPSIVEKNYKAPRINIPTSNLPMIYNP